MYERMRAIIDGLTRRAGWDDPEMDVYAGASELDHRVFDAEDSS
jgi:hypothetical protein